MKKTLLIPIAIAIVLILVGAGVGIFLFISSSQPKELEAKEDQKEFLEKTAQVISDNNNRVQAAGDMKMKQNNIEITTTATVHIDGDNGYSQIKNENAELTFIGVEGEMYFKDKEGTWFKMPDSDEQSTSDLSTGTEALNPIEALKNSDKFEYVGLEDCDGKKCQVFLNKDEKNGDTKFTIDAKTHKILTMSSDSGEATGSLNVTYDNTEVKAPENYKDVEGMEAFGKLFEVFAALFGQN
ncbi:MAG: hypothetical protein ACOCXT_02220 [Candidatus Dojkabacteria bacterium]